MQSSAQNVLILGASYGSLLGTKLLLAGHSVTLVCTPGTADLINRNGTLVRLPVRGMDTPVSIDSRALSASLLAATPDQVEPAGYDLVVLAMQEPQYSSPGVRELLEAVARARVPCMAIMNMPPLPYLARLPGIDPDKLRACYTEPAIWDSFEPGLVTLASPDPQAFRPPDEAKNVLHVSLPTNFKVARFEAPQHTEMLRQLQDDILAVRHRLPDGIDTELPVKLRLFDSLFVPLAKWSMLITGNYRCVGERVMRAFADAVHSDLDESRAIYQWVADVCVGMGADPADMVPFEKYAAAAQGLSKPSSAARALFSGATHIERVDLVVQHIAAQRDLKLDLLDRTVRLVDERLALNRQDRQVS
jgi:hypothetical protein